MKKLMFVLFIIMENGLEASEVDFLTRKKAEDMLVPIVTEYEETLRDLDKARHLATTVGDFSISKEDVYASIPKRMVDFYKIVEKLMPSGKIDSAKVEALAKISELTASLIADYNGLYSAKKRLDNYKRRYLAELESDRYVEPALSPDMDPNAREDYKEKAAADFRENHSDLIREAFNSYRRLNVEIASLLSRITEKEVQLAAMNAAEVEGSLGGVAEFKGG